MGNLTSPGIAINEFDFTAIIPSESSITGAICGTFFAGPIGTPVLVSSEAELTTIFGKPTDLNYATFFTAANFLQYSNSLYVVRADSNANFNAVSSAALIKILNRDDYELNYFGSVTYANTKFVIQYPGAKGNSVAVAVCSDKNKFDTSSINGVNLYANVIVGSSTISFNANVQPYISTGSSQYIYIGNYTTPFSNVVSVSNNVIVVGTDQLGIVTANANTSSARARWIYSTAFETPLSTSTYTSLTGGSNDEMHILVLDTQGKVTGQVGQIIERYPNVSKAADAKTDDGSTNYYVEVLKAKSAHVWAMNHLETNWGSMSTGTTFTSNNSQYITFTNGSSGTPTDSDVINGYDLFSDKDNITVNLLMAGDGDGGSSVVISKVMSIADTRKDCLACVSPATLSMCSPSSTLLSTGIIQSLALFKGTIAPLSSYSILDCAWKYQFDKYLNKYRFVPLNGDVAGLIAKTSTDRDAWWSPAGLNRGKIQNAIRLSWNPNQTQRDELYKISINPIISIPNEGIVLYGDKTLLNTTSAFSRINVRSLFILLEKSISKAAKYSLFEFNDEFTRSQFSAMVEPFLRNIKAKRGIYDYKVICDSTNNTPEVIDSNKFVGSIFVKPARSINFIELNFIAVGTAIDFTIITNNAGI